MSLTPDRVRQLSGRAGQEAVALCRAVHVRYSLAFAAARILPEFAAGRLITGVYRLAGFKIGRGTTICGALRLISGGPLHDNLVIGDNVILSTDVTLNLDDRVTIGDATSIGPYVRIYTGSHGIGPGSRRMMPQVVSKPVVIGRGAWIGLGATVLPGVSIGDGCVVGSGSVVMSDLEAHCYAEGNPAVKVRSLPWSDR